MKNIFTLVCCLTGFNFAYAEIVTIPTYRSGIDECFSQFEKVDFNDHKKF